MTGNVYPWAASTIPGILQLLLEIICDFSCVAVPLTQLTSPLHLVPLRWYRFSETKGIVHTCTHPSALRVGSSVCGGGGCFRLQCGSYPLWAQFYYSQTARLCFLLPQSPLSRKEEFKRWEIRSFWLWFWLYKSGNTGWRKPESRFSFGLTTKTSHTCAHPEDYSFCLMLKH